MGKYVDRNFIKNLCEIYFYKRRKHFNSCKCWKCERYYNLIEQMDKWSFDNFNFYHNNWFFIYNLHNYEVTLFPVFI